MSDFKEKQFSFVVKNKQLQDCPILSLQFTISQSLMDFNYSSFAKGHSFEVYNFLEKALQYKLLKSKVVGTLSIILLRSKKWAPSLGIFENPA